MGVVGYSVVIRRGIGDWGGKRREGGGDRERKLPDMRWGKSQNRIQGRKVGE